MEDPIMSLCVSLLFEIIDMYTARDYSGREEGRGRGGGGGDVKKY
jgi:hypothetical protein